MAQSQNQSQSQSRTGITETRTAEQPARSPARPPARPPPGDLRDRAYMGGGMVVTPGFSGGGFGADAPPAPRRDLAPRPNLDLEMRVGPPQPETATLSPAMIHPRLPRSGVASDGAASQREQRLLQTPAAGARLSVPMIW